MAGPIVVSVIGDVRDLVKGTRTARGELTGLGKVADRAGKIVAGAAVAGGAALVAFGVKSVRSASAAQQSIGATESVFGKYADTVIRRSQQAAEAVGLSANEYRELNNVTGAMLASAGTPLAKVADLTDDLTKRAADLAATFGGTTREAVSAIGSLLRGEADPIERYGISIKQADVNARLAAKGLDKLEGASRKQAEQTERLALLFEQSRKSAGQFGREADTLAGQQQRLGAKVEDLEAKFGDLLLPALTDLVAFASDKGVPALEDLADWIGDNRDEFADIGSTIKGDVLPVLEALGDVVTGLVGFWSDLPDPIKSTAVQLGVAALVFPRVAAGLAIMGDGLSSNTARLKQFHAELTYTETRAAAVAGGMSRLASASRDAAGVGGMAALTLSATSSNKAINVLGSTAGGALMGFSVGGPIGAAIGAGAGALVGLATSTDKATEALHGAAPAAADYASSLDQITGAATRATRAVALKALQDLGADKSAAALGLSVRDVVSATLGQEGALNRVNAVLAQSRQIVGTYIDSNGQLQTAYGYTNDDAARLSIALEGQTDVLARQIDKTRAAALATGDLGKVLRGIPPRIATQIAQTGDPERLTRLLERYVRQGKLVPKQIKTAVVATGLAPAGADVDRFVRNLVKNAAKADKAGQQTGAGYTTGAQQGVNKGKGKVDTAAAKAVEGAARNAQPKARSGGTNVGWDLTSGVAVGISSGVSIVNAAATAIINSALAAMRVAADSHSPSRKAARVGGDMGDGLDVGLRRKRNAARAAGRDLVNAVLGSMTQGAEGVNAAIDKVADKYVKAYNRAHKKNLKPKDVRALNAALDAAGKSLSKIADQYARTRTLAKETTDAARVYASITTLGDFGVGAATGAQGIVTGLEARLTAIKAFQTDLDVLARQGINKTTLEQLLAAGVDQGSAYADALAKGGAAAIAQVNGLQAQINAATQSLGDKIAPQVTGLDPAKVKTAAEAAAAQIAAILRRRLGVNITVAADGRGRAQINTQRTPVNVPGVRRGVPELSARITLSAEQISQLERGRRISADLKAYQKAGGR